MQTSPRLQSDGQGNGGVSFWAICVLKAGEEWGSLWARRKCGPHLTVRLQSIGLDDYIETGIPLEDSAQLDDGFVGTYESSPFHGDS